MKKVLISTLILAGLFSCSSDQNVAKTKEEPKQEVVFENSDIDLKASKIYWIGSKITGGKHRGEVSLLSGKLNWDNGKPSTGSFVVDMNSITCSDIKDEESNSDLVNHLKSDDFFAVKQFPTTKVEILGIKENETDGMLMAALEVEIRGIKQTVPAQVQIRENNGEKFLSGRMELNRTEFGVIYNSSNFFKSLGDKVINDQMMFKFNIKLN